jgi:hypothetical protein
MTTGGPMKLVNLAALSLLAGCASVPPPSQQLGAARAMVAQAQPLAMRDAPMEFVTAQNKLARAEEAMKREDYANARIYAEQAEADARYALILAENARAQRAAAEVTRGMSTLQQELERRVQ